jgi:hypothetical protein
MSMVGTMCWGASGAGSGVPAECWGVNVAMDGNSGISTVDRDGAYDDGKASRSGTCPPTC